MALCHDVPRAAFAAPALGGNAQLKLDLVKAHASARMAGDFTVGYPAADTDDHFDGAAGLAMR